VGWAGRRRGERCGCDERATPPRPALREEAAELDDVRVAGVVAARARLRRAAEHDREVRRVRGRHPERAVHCSTDDATRLE
jgi:hypothetical protein